MVKLGTKVFEYEKLSKLYGQFKNPYYEVLIDDKDIVKKELMRVSELIVEDSVEKADYARVVISNSYDFSDAAFRWTKDYFQVGKSLEIKLGYSKKTEEVFTGYITNVTFEVSAENGDCVIIEGMDASFLMMTGEKNRIWYKKKYSDVIKDIAKDYGLKTKITATDIEYEMIVQNHRTDYEFSKTIADSIGFELFTVGNTLYFRKLNEVKTSSLTLSTLDNLLNVSYQQTLLNQLQEINIKDYNYKQEELEGSAKKVTKLGKGTLIGGELLKKVNSKAGIHNIYGSLISNNEAKLITQGYLDKNAMKFISGNCRLLGLPVIRAGNYLTLKGLWGKKSNIFYIMDCRHSITDEGFITEYMFGGNSI